MRETIYMQFLRKRFTQQGNMRKTDARLSQEAHHFVLSFVVQELKVHSAKKHSNCNGFSVKTVFNVVFQSFIACIFFFAFSCVYFE